MAARCTALYVRMLTHGGSVQAAATVHGTATVTERTALIYFTASYFTASYFTAMVSPVWLDAPPMLTTTG